MRDETVARNYAETLFELALRHEGLEAFQDALDMVAGLLDEHPGFRKFLETPRIDAKDKKDVLSDALEGRVPPTFLKFLLVTIDKRRQRLIRGMAREFHGLVDEHLGRAHLEVTAARSLSDETVERIGARFSELLDKQAIPHVRVRPEILGGVIVRTGDTVYDGSLRRRMESLRRRLLSADLPDGHGAGARGPRR